MKNKSGAAEVNLKLKFDNVQQLLRLVDLLRLIDCPMQEEVCDNCLYLQSCLKLREITNKLLFSQMQKGG